MNQPQIPPDQDPELEPDPLFVNSLQESGWILLMWLCCFIWTLSFCLTYGYQENVDPKTFSTVFGIPAWVAYGIALPWLIADIVTIWFCFFRMKDGDLGRDAGDDAFTGVDADEGGQSNG